MTNQSEPRRAMTAAEALPVIQALGADVQTWTPETDLQRIAVNELEQLLISAAYWLEQYSFDQERQQENATS